MSREEVTRDGQHLMSHGDDGSWVAASPFDPLVQGGERRRFRPTLGRGSFDHRHPQGRIAVPRTRSAIRFPTEHMLQVLGVDNHRAPILQNVKFQ